MRDLGLELQRDAVRERAHRHGAVNLAEDAALRHADGLAERDERDLDIDRTIELHLDEVDVLERARDRVIRVVLDHDEEVFAALDLHLEHGVLAALALEDDDHVLRDDRKHRRREVLTVGHRRDLPGAAEAANGALALLGAGRGGDVVHGGGHGVTPRNLESVMGGGCLAERRRRG